MVALDSYSRHDWTFITSFIVNFLSRFVSGLSLGVGSFHDWLSVDVSGPISQVKDKEKNREDDARDLVHFANPVVGLLYAFCDVFAIHPGEPHLWLRGRGRCRTCVRSALGDGSQSRLLGYVYRISGADDVERVVGLFGEGG